MGTTGVLRVYLGAAPGVGKSFRMLEEGHRRRDRGTDVVIGLVEAHGRLETAALIGDLEVVPRIRRIYRIPCPMRWSAGPTRLSWWI